MTNFGEICIMENMDLLNRFMTLDRKNVCTARKPRAPLDS